MSRSVSGIDVALLVVLQRPQHGVARGRADDEHLEAFARREEQLGCVEHLPNGVAVFADDGERLAFEREVVPDVGTDVREPPELHLTRRDLLHRKMLRVHDAERRRVAVDVVGFDVVTDDLRVLEPDRDVLDVAEVGR